LSRLCKEKEIEGGRVSEGGGEKRESEREREGEETYNGRNERET
jgi:hypothetical protein